MRTNLQVPMDKTLRDAASEAASEQGFSSLQDAVRLFLTQLSKRKVNVSITPNIPDEVLTPSQEKNSDEEVQNRER